MLHDQFRIERIFSNWRLRPCFGEPARSYYARLVMDTEEFEPEPYARRMGIFGGGDPMDRVLGAVLALPISDNEKESLVKWSPRGRGARKLGSGRYDLSAQTVLSNKYCPECVREAPYHRSWWDRPTMIRCVVHDRPLVSSGTSKAFPFYGPVKGGIECGRIPRDNDGSFDSYQLQCLGVVDPISPRPLMDYMPLDAVGYYVERVGRLLSNPKCERTPKQSPAAYEVGFEALGKSKRHLENRLSDWLVANNSPDELKTATLANYGWGEHIGNYLAGTRNIKLFDYLSTAQVRACARHGLLPNRLLARDDVDSPMTVTKAAREFETTAHGIGVFLARVGGAYVMSGTNKIIAPPVLERMRTEYTRLCSTAEAARKLGCTQAQVRSLGRLKKLRYLQSPGKGEGSIRYFGPEIDDLIAALPTEPPPTGQRMLSLSEYLRKTEKKGGNVIRDVIEGRVTCFMDPSGQGIGGLRFPMLRHPRPPRGRPAALGRKPLSNDMMLRAEFTALTGIPASGVTHLVASGILVSDAVCVAPVERASALAFHRRYINANRYFATKGILSKEASAELERLRIPRSFAYPDVEAVVVSRAEFERKTGFVTSSSPASEVLWQILLDVAKIHCPSFVLPPVPVDCRSTIRTASRKSSFLIQTEQDSLEFRIILGEYSNPRLWRLYQTADEMRGIMPSFKWRRSKSSASGKAAARNREELEVIARELGRISEAFSYKMP